MIAVTHGVSPHIHRCELTHRPREPLDLDLARRQHAAYQDALRRHGFTVVELTVNLDLPDSVFVEDTAVVLDEIAVLCRPGAPSRRKEVPGIRPVLERYRPVAEIRAAGTLDGGDVLRVGKTLFVGLSSRTNLDGLEQLRALLTPYGYQVKAVSVHGCLHLKTAVTAADEDTLVAYPEWIDMEPFHGFRVLEVPKEEAEAANVLRLNRSVLVAEGFPRTEKMLRDAGFSVETVDISELRKAEAGLTCSSLLVT
ncbi:dimethylargininase [Desulfacinum infernum DSM 9756]|uniref:Dimethylargininase n=1 Tax=Desulfacinum infernum DSM 9756 TaxID=1121391 RepID=A0A1M5E6H9_9BACT|nr:arginine deiminase family protein [Desulfacinum infernum]SHF74744.1 dimethylargininase [Desulfacinum infernum DSM 9756]